MLLEAGSWDHLRLPAIATEDEVIPLTRGRAHFRRCGDVLHPERESRETLEWQRAQMGSYAFAAQYQQAPVPAEGNIFKAAWLKSYDDLDPAAGGEIVQSWDTGIKTAEGNSFSVGITALVRQRYVYIIDVWRGRLEFPDLKRKVIELALLHRTHTLLIEDKALGEPLIQALRSEPLPPGVPFPIPCQPHNDKRTRAEGVSSMVEAGQVLLPREAHWLGEFKSELLSFPSGRYDDQVDALSQMLAWVRRGWTDPAPCDPGPMLWVEGEGWSGEDCPVDLGQYRGLDPWGG
jgi:predicted phage terminase large subunit-like protein